MKAHDLKFTYETWSYRYSMPLSNSFCGECTSHKVFKYGWYTPDFFINGDKFIIETKGKFTGKDRTKMIAVKQAHPELDIRMVFMRDNKLSKLSSTRYSTWAEKHGFPYCIGMVLPSQWIEEFKQS